MSAGAPPSPAQGSPPAPTPAPPVVVRRKGDRGRIYLVAAVVVVAAIIIGVGAGTSWYGLKTSSSAACPSGVTLQGNGASFPAPLVSQWTTSFDKSTGDTVNYPGNGAVAGITDLIDRSVDFAITDEGLTSAQSTAMTNNVSTVLTLPITGGAVVMTYYAGNLSYPGPLNLTGTQLAGIYLGLITTWAQLASNNPGLAKNTQALTATHRADGAGMSYVLTNFMTDQNKTWATTSGLGTSTLPQWPAPSGSNTYGASGNSAMLKYLKKTPGAIGYTDLYDAEESGLALASIVNAQGNPIVPSEASAASAIADVYSAIGSTLPSPTGDWSSVSWVNASGAEDYPLSTLVYLMVPQNPAKGHTASATDATALREWINWVVTTGQTYNTTQFPYVSPPKPLLTEDLSALSGMNFNGAVLPSCS